MALPPIYARQSATSSSSGPAPDRTDWRAHPQRLLRPMAGHGRTRPAFEDSSALCGSHRGTPGRRDVRTSLDGSPSTTGAGRSNVVRVPVPLSLLPLASWFPHGNWPRLPCGSCDVGELRVGTATEIDVAAQHRDHPGWEPEWIHGFFTLSAQCSNRDCSQGVAVIVGDMKVDADVDERGHWHGEYHTFYRIRYVDPPLALVKVPSGCPDDVSSAIADASRLLWIDSGSAANRLRTVVELLLTALGVRKTTSGRKHMTTHARIEALRTTRPDVADVLEAVKWIGNVGSHAEAPSTKDVLEGAALLEHSLKLVYDASDKEIARLAKRVNKRRGRPSKA